MRTSAPVEAVSSIPQQLEIVAGSLEERWPDATKLLAEAENDVLAYMPFPASHWTRIYSTNPLERVNREIHKRTNVVGIFPDDASVIRLVGSILKEIDDKWQVQRRYFGIESMKLLTEPEHVLAAEPAPLRLAPIKQQPRGRMSQGSQPKVHH